MPSAFLGTKTSDVAYLKLFPAPGNNSVCSHKQHLLKSVYVQLLFVSGALQQKGDRLRLGFRIKWEGRDQARLSRKQEFRARADMQKGGR
jgi:hypothetical protein